MRVLIEYPLFLSVDSKIFFNFNILHRVFIFSLQATVAFQESLKIVSYLIKESLYVVTVDILVLDILIIQMELHLYFVLLFSITICVRQGKRKRVSNYVNFALKKKLVSVRYEKKINISIDKEIK